MWWSNHLALVSGRQALQKALNHGFQKQQKANLLSQKNEDQDLLRIKNQENWARPKNPVPDQKSSFFGSKFTDQITSRQTWSIKKRRFHSKTRSAKLCKKNVRGGVNWEQKQTSKESKHIWEANTSLLILKITLVPY